jgi:hypothetical protein
VSLVHRVLQYVDAARRSPAQASSPEWLGSLEADAFTCLDGAFFALNAPVAPLTWEVRTVMPGNQLQSARIPFDFPYPCEILGFRSVVAPFPGQALGLIDPSSVTGDGRDVVDVQLDIDKKAFVTFNEGDQPDQPTTQPSQGSFVSLSSVDIQAPRIQALRLLSPRPQIGFTFQWSLGVTVPFQDSLIKVAMFIREMRGMGQSVNVGQPYDNR